MREARLAILFSGNGSNLENIYRKMQNLIIDSVKVKLNFALAVSSKESAYGVTRCKNLGLKCEVVDYKKNKVDFFPKIMQILRNAQIDLVILAGFMRILPPEFNANFRAINIHPSILPLFKGANAIKESFESDMKIAGVSVHFVSDELDGGALIAQDIIYKIEGESLESFERRIHELEYEIYPKAIIKAIQIAGNSVLGMQFRTCENFGESTDSSLVLSPKFSQIQKPHRNHFDCDSLRKSTANQIEIAESRLDSAESQNLNENNLCEAPENSPASWCKKSESKGAVVPPADFLLEAEKRGSPPKSEKAAAFWGHNKKELGGAGRGVQPFLREKTSENNSNENAESTLDSANPAPSTHEANSSIADEFLGLCEASDKDKTKVHRGSEPKHSLKSRCETTNL